MNEVQDLNLTFSGCGFLGIYHLGVVSCLKENAPALLKRVKCYGGASAGSFAATALLLDLNISDSAEFVLRLAKRANSLTLGPLHPSFNVVRTLRKSFERILPDNAHEIVSGRLHLSLTRVSDLKNVIVSEFSSKEDLVEVSCSFQKFHISNCTRHREMMAMINFVDEKFTKNLPQADFVTLRVLLSRTIQELIVIVNEENRCYLLDNSTFCKATKIYPGSRSRDTQPCNVQSLRNGVEENPHV